MTQGDAKTIVQWFSELPKDEEYANLLDEIVKKRKINCLECSNK
jgi:hypothetical protein